MHFVVFGGEEPAIGYYQGKVRGEGRMHLCFADGRRPAHSSHQGHFLYSGSGTGCMC